MKWSEKASGFAASNCCALNLKWSEKTVFEQKFAFSLAVFLFTCGNFTLFFFSIFWMGIFLNGFRNPFTAHSRPRFLFELNFYFSLVVLFTRSGFLASGFVFLMQIFCLTIFRFSSRIFFDFSGDFFTLSFFIFQWSLLLSLRSKACC